MDEDGSVTVLTLGLVTVVLMVLVGLAQVGHLFLAQRSLAATCDGAAVAGVQALDTDAVYTGEGTRLDLGEARRDVARWSSESDADVTVVGLSPDGRGVTVECERLTRVPFSGIVGIGPQLLRTRSSARMP